MYNMCVIAAAQIQVCLFFIYLNYCTFSMNKIVNGKLANILLLLLENKLDGNMVSQHSERNNPIQMNNKIVTILLFLNTYTLWQFDILNIISVLFL